MNRIEGEIRASGDYSVGYNGVAVVYNTFGTDFTIADSFGVGAVRDTYKRAKKAWREDIRYMTALCITLNHKLWQHYENGNTELAKVYDELWKDCDAFILDGEEDGEDYKYNNFTKEEVGYFIRATD